MRQRVGFRDVLAVREFRALWGAEVISVCGDQLARVALSVLVYQRTSSAALTAFTYALTFVPALLGGAVLGGLADRFPRHTVLIATDVVRAGLAGAIALPGLPLVVVCTLVLALALAGAPFKAAQLALLPSVLDTERYPVGLALRTVSTQLAQLVGFAGGGAVLLVISPQTALGVNALTFLVSAMVVAGGVRARPATRSIKADPGSDRAVSAMALLSGNPTLLVLVGFIVLAGLTVAPEGVAAPYAAGLGGSTAAVGVLLAADPLGSAIGAWIFKRWHTATAQTAGPTTRIASIGPWAIGSGAVLIPCALRPGLVISALLWALSGALATAVLIHAQALLTLAVPDSRRGAVIGLASAGLQTSQGVVVLAAGLVGQHLGVYRAVGIVGVVTVMIAVGLGVGWRRARLRSPSTTAGNDGQEGSEDEHGMSHGMSAIFRGHGCACMPPSSRRPSRSVISAWAPSAVVRWS
jgi:MFS transporter